MKILLFGLGDLYSLGGVQSSYSHLLSHLCGAGHSVSFYSPREKPEGAKVFHEFPSSVNISHYRLVDSPAGRKVVRDIAVAEDPDVVLIVNSSQTALIQSMALFDTEYPVVLSERGGNDHNLRYNWGTLLQRHVAHYSADVTHLLMSSYRKALPEWMAPQIHIIPSLIEPAEGGLAAPETPNGQVRFSILYTGRLAFEKDLAVLVRAFAALAAEYTNWDLDLYGDGPEFAALKALAFELKLSTARVGPTAPGDRVRLWGAVAPDEVDALYRKAHIFALPSRAEGCPLSLREAMARGLPVVGFADCSGTNEIIVDGRNGLLAAGSDRTVSMTAALRCLMRSGSLRGEMGRAGIEDVRIYSPRSVLGAWEKMLLSAAALKGKRTFARARRAALNPREDARFRALLTRLRDLPRWRNIYLFDDCPSGEDAGLIADYALLYGSVLFDHSYYLRENFVAKAAGADPLLHYLREGWRQNLGPSAMFDAVYYQSHAVDREETQAPLVHYYRSGRYSGAMPNASPSPDLTRALADELAKDGDLAWIYESGIQAEAAARWFADNLSWNRLIQNADFRRAVVETSERSPAASMATRRAPASSALHISQEPASDRSIAVPPKALKIVTNLPPFCRHFVADGVVLMDDTTTDIDEFDAGLQHVPFDPSGGLPSFAVVERCRTAARAYDLWLDEGTDLYRLPKDVVAHAAQIFVGNVVPSGHDLKFLPPLVEYTRFHPFGHFTNPPLHAKFLVHSDDVADFIAAIDGAEVPWLAVGPPGDSASNFAYSRNTVAFDQLWDDPAALREIEWLWITDHWRAPPFRHLARRAVACGAGVATRYDGPPIDLPGGALRLPSPQILSRDDDPLCVLSAEALRHTQRRALIIDEAPWIGLNAAISSRFGSQWIWLLPKASIFSVTRQASSVASLIAAFQTQIYADKEIVITAHGVPYKDLLQQERPLAEGRINVIGAPSEMSDHFCVSLAIDECGGDFSIEMTDTDTYGPFYVYDMMINAVLMNADMCSKTSKFFYYGDREHTVVRPTDPIRLQNPPLLAKETSAIGIRVNCKTRSGKRSILQQRRFSYRRSRTVDGRTPVEAADELRVYTFDAFNKITFAGKDHPDVSVGMTDTDGGGSMTLHSEVASRWVFV